MEASQNAPSKVKVEYTDPSGVYPKIAPDLVSRLPLRNLNWYSHTRPLRSIESLFVDVVPDEKAAQSLTGSTSHDEQSGASRSLDQSVPHKERRHQIPGLRSTPYLKIYLLRCDDSETYKASSRKLLREWIKSHATASQGKGHNNQENHDAFEWLIIHIAPVEGSAWPTKSSASVLEKVKSDFNGSSKSSIDRVTQIPCAFDIPGGNAAEAVQPGPAREQFLREASRGWEDLLTRFKALILSSFDSRVGQYEEDIKEKGSQRSIPGWNFCTFFVLKEGLARGFESVGLLEDALMGYDELSIELLSAMRAEEEKALSGEGASLFQDSTEELLAQAQAALDGSEEVKSSSAVTHAMSLDAERKPYRELILANKISVFEFRSYVFARQVAVLMRIASLSGRSPSAAQSARSGADPGALAEICYRATSFIASNSRTIRQDLRSSLKANETVNEGQRAVKHGVIENIVASWSYTTLQLVLMLTNDAVLSRELDSMNQSASGMVPRPQQYSRDGSQPLSHPTRSTSFVNRPQSIPLQHSHPDGFTEEALSVKSAPLPNKNVALYRLASQRAELYLLCRRALSNIGERNQWHTGWKSVSSTPLSPAMDDVSLEDSGTAQEDKVLARSVSPDVSFNLSILGESLRSDTESKDAFNESYENLSWSAHNLYQFSGDEKSVHAMITDIATLKFRLHDFTTAASYFHELAPFYADQNWSELELAILDMYARCLKELGKSEEYVRIGLKLLAKIITSRQHNVQSRNDQAPSFSPATVNPDEHIRSILEASKNLKEPCLVHLRNYFLDVTVSPHIEHLPNTDGFALKVSLGYILNEEVDAILKIRLISASETQTREVWLSSSEPVKLKRGSITAIVASNILFPDRYLVDRLLIQAEKVTFQHDYAPRDLGTRPGSRDSASYRNINVQTEPLIVWAQKRSFRVSATSMPDMHLDKPRAALFTLATGDDPVTSVKLLVKAATAGLRLYTSETAIVEGDFEIADKARGGYIVFEGVPAKKTIKVSIPFQMDTEFKQILLRSEVTYSTNQGTFVYGDSHPISVILSLGVNVQDIFKTSELYSRFSISCSTSVPLSILNYTVKSTKSFEATTCGANDDRISVFTKQPMSLVYRITRRKDLTRAGELETRLSMQVEYQCLDEEIIAAVQDCLSRSLDSSKFARFQPLLSSHLLETLQEKLPNQDLELIGLLREIGLASYPEFRWNRILTALPAADRQPVIDWLEQWHKANEIIALPRSGSSALIRKVTIPVDVPPMHVLHTAQLRLFSGTQSSAASLLQTHSIAVGEAVPAEITIRHTRIWAQSDVGAGRELLFCYELDASPDTWLIGGRRRATFAAKEGEEKKFAVLLLPQRAGKLLLPTLEITLTEGQQGAEAGAQERAADSQLSCEVDYLSQAEAILVVPGLKSTTVAMDLEGSQAWLVDAEAGSRSVRAR